MLKDQTSKYVILSLLHLALQNNALEETKLTFTPSSESGSDSCQFMPKGWPTMRKALTSSWALQPPTSSFPASCSSFPRPWHFPWGSLYLFSANNWGINSYMLGRIFPIVLQMNQLKQNCDTVLLWLRLISGWLRLEDTIADKLFKRPILLI